YPFFYRTSVDTATEVDIVKQAWTLDPLGPRPIDLQGPVPLAAKGMGIPNDPGMYLITSGPCLSHVGTSNKLRGRVGTLARLGNHRGSAEVLGVAFCTAEAPLVWWDTCPDVQEARRRESEFKHHY